MDRFGKIWLYIFLIISIFPIIDHIANFEGIKSIFFIIIAILLNLFVAYFLLFIINSFSNRLIKTIGSLILILISIWYIANYFILYQYNSFVSFSGLSFFWYMFTIIGKVIIVLTFLAITLFSFYISKKINKKEKSMKIFLIFTLLIILTFILLPQSYLLKISPFTEILAIKYHVPKIIPSTSISNESIFNLSLENKNLIIILLESVPSKQVSAYGYYRNITPNINWFANNGIFFNNAYTSATHTDYVITSFLSSRYPLKDSIRDTFTEDYPRTFIWDTLKQKNYSTGYFTSQNDNWMNINNYLDKSNLNEYSHSLTDGEYAYGLGNSRKDYDNETLNKAINFINQSSKPFFVYVNFHATHYPYNYPPNNSLYLPDEPSIFSFYGHLAEEDNQTMHNRYDNSLFYVDKQVGKLKEYLQTNNLLNNTIIVILGDHGEAVEVEHGFMVHGSTLYQEAVKIPLIFYIPGVKPLKLNYNVKQLDVIPTILKIMNFSSSPLFQGKDMKKESPIYFMSQNQIFNIGMIKGDIKYIINLNTGFINEAYNLTSDPLELNNLYSDTNPEWESYAGELINWYTCQLNYYDGEGYKTNSSINC